MLTARTAVLRTARVVSVLARVSAFQKEPKVHSVSVKRASWVAIVPLGARETPSDVSAVARNGELARRTALKELLLASVNQVSWARSAVPPVPRMLLAKCAMVTVLVSWMRRLKRPVVSVKRVSVATSAMLNVLQPKMVMCVTVTASVLPQVARPHARALVVSRVRAVSTTVLAVRRVMARLPAVVMVLVPWSAQQRLASAPLVSSVKVVAFLARRGMGSPVAVRVPVY